MAISPFRLTFTLHATEGRFWLQISLACRSRRRTAHSVPSSTLRPSGAIAYDREIS